MEVVDNGYRTITGLTTGKKTSNLFRYASGKNAGRRNGTTAKKQALLEATAIWNKRRELGYFKRIKDVDKKLAGVDVMLAHTLDDFLDPTKPKRFVDVTKGVLVQNKYNGVRCTARLERGRVVLRSREFQIWGSVPHINKDLEQFFAAHPTAVLDGELYNYDLRQKLNELIKIVRTEKPTVDDNVKSEQMVRYYVYDGYNFGRDLGEDSPYTMRKEFIDAALQRYTKYCRKVKTWAVSSMADLESLYERFLAVGDEGAIIRIPSSGYEHGRSRNLLKYKPEDDDEGTLLTVEEGKGNWAGAAKRFTIRWHGKVFAGAFKGKYARCVEFFRERAKWIGRTDITFFYTGFSGLGTPNYARIDPDNCIKGDR
jgi:ATP-dependent DNA ligase